MRDFLKRFITFPESPMRLFASWFIGCALFQMFRSQFVMPTWVLLLVAGVTFVVLTAAQHWLPFPRLSAAALALGTMGYALTLVATHPGGDNMALTTVILFVVAVVLYPLVKREKHELLPFKIGKKTGVALCVIAAVLFTAVLGTITCFRYLTFSSPNYDFGIFCNMFHNMSTTGLPTVSCERETIISHFAVHISPTYYLILPFYLLAPSPLTLQVAQAVILASGMLPLYLLARHYKLSHALTAVIVAVYAMYPALSTGCYYDLHENCFLTPLLLWLFLCYEKQCYALLTIPTILLLGVKEDAAAYLVFFGIYLLIARRDWRRGLPLIVIPVLYFIAAVSILQHYGTGAMFGRYGEILSSNKDTGGLIGTLIRDPAFFLKQIAQSANWPQKLQWLFTLLVPLGALVWTPRRKYGRLLLLLPLLLNLVTQYGYQFNVDFQYSFGIIPFLFYLLVLNAADSERKPRREHLTFSLAASCLLYTLLVLPQLGHYVSSYIRQYDTFTRMEQTLDQVPDGVSVIASSVLVPHLADRSEIYEDEYHPTPDTAYIVLDMRPAFVNSSSKYYLTAMEHGYQLVTETEEILILKAPQA